MSRQSPRHLSLYCELLIMRLSDYLGTMGDGYLPIVPVVFLLLETTISYSE